MIYTLPYPTSVNRLWTIAKNARRIVPTKGARYYKQEVGWLLAETDPLSGMVMLTIRVYRPRKAGDLDNVLKVALDACEGYMYVNDKQIEEIHAYRFDDKHNPRIEIEVKKL